MSAPCHKLPYSDPDQARREARNGASGALRPYRCHRHPDQDAAVYHLASVSPARLRRIRATRRRTSAEPIPTGPTWDDRYVPDAGSLLTDTTPEGS
jgi:hypothetical protein